MEMKKELNLEKKLLYRMLSGNREDSIGNIVKYVILLYNYGKKSLVNLHYGETFMDKMRKAFSVVLLSMIVISSVLLFPNKAYSESTPSLVLVEAQKGKWTAYGDMSCNSANGCPMIKVMEFCDAIGYDYSSSNSTKQFSILKTAKVKNVYTLGKKEYAFYAANGKKANKTAKDSAYYDKTLKTNLCDANSISTVCNTKVFSTSGTKYSELTYSKVVCYSKYSAVGKLPDIEKILYEDGTPVYDPGPAYKSPDGKWRATMFHMDGILNGKRNKFFLSQGYHVDTMNNFIVLDDLHNETVSSNLPALQIEISSSAKQGVTYTKETMGQDIKFDLCSFTNGIGHDWEDNYIKEKIIRLDTLDRDSGTVVGYVKVIGEDSSKNKYSLEGYFADSLKSHPKDMDSQQYQKVKNGNSAGTTNSNNTNSSNSSNSSVNSTNASSRLKLVTVPCTNCGGTGKITCIICHGVGYSERMGYRYGVYGRIVDPCLACGGAGAHICSRCGGSGSITQLSTK
jgi:hypothetical protein